MEMESPKIVVITGANTGLGFEVAKALFSFPDPYHILIGCRGDVSRADEAVAKLKGLYPDSKSTAESLSVDISDDKSIEDAFKTVQSKYDHIDALVNNAGADFTAALQAGRISTREAFNKAWDVNVTGTHIMTEAFMPLLTSSKTMDPRLLFITSGISSLTEFTSGVGNHPGYPAKGWPKPASEIYKLPLTYRASKTGMNMMAAEWARLLREDGVKVFNISPGFLATGLGIDRETGDTSVTTSGALDPAIGGNFVADVIAGKRDEQAWPPKVIRKHMVQPF